MPVMKRTFVVRNGVSGADMGTRDERQLRQCAGLVLASNLHHQRH
jgi:hypothetical protein